MANILFDFDGTLHDSLKIYAPAFRAAYRYLEDKKLARRREWTDAEIQKWIGYSSCDMWERFFPALPRQEKEMCSRSIGDEMLNMLHMGAGRLYEGAEETLRVLRQEGHNLIFLSNCNLSYMRECIRAFSLEQFFNAFYCTEMYDYLPKHKIFKEISQKHDEEFIVIGDREADMQIAELNGLKSIGCLYGYGNCAELKSATILINKPIELLKALEILKR